MKPFTEEQVLEELNHVSENMGENRSNGSFYHNFFLDLEDTRLSVIGNRIHLYADSTSWAVVFEKNGYSISGGYPEINLEYVGNCISYETKDRNGGTEYNNLFIKELIDTKEVDDIRSKEMVDNLIRKDVEFITVNGHKVRFEQAPKEYERYGIELIEDDEYNPQKLIPFDSFIKYIKETQPEVLYVDEAEIKKHFLKDIPKLMTIDKYHYTSIYDDVLPSDQELFQLIAKILVTKDTTLWKPTQPANNHWSSWKSGWL